jgi:hypothetical protein
MKFEDKVSQLENDVPYALKSDVEVEASNGVYAVTADNKLIDYHTADSSCIGVAFISANQKVMIAKANAADGTNTNLYWGYNLYGEDVFNLKNLADATTARADYNGKANTAAIIIYHEPFGSMDSRDMCKVLETYNEGGYTDWYVPAAGQLYEFYTNKAAINEALAAISGIEFINTSYWSSSENSANRAWSVNFYEGDVSSISKNYYNHVRFVRDLTIKKPLKEKVTDLETKVKELNAVLVDTEEEADDPIVSEYVTLTQLENKLSNKQDTLVSGVNIKTINGESILGEGDIAISGAYAEVNHGTGYTTFTLTPNTFHVWDRVASLDLSFANEQVDVTNEYTFQFTSGATPTSLTLPDTIQWVNGAPNIEANKIYQVSIVNNIGLIVSV